MLARINDENGPEPLGGFDPRSRAIYKWLTHLVLLLLLLSSDDLVGCVLHEVISVRVVERGADT